MAICISVEDYDLSREICAILYYRHFLLWFNIVAFLSYGIPFLLGFTGKIGVLEEHITFSFADVLTKW